ncbi:phospholipase A and acyltransferase 4-like [Myotis yumanensis]|uniref:phospholipase A and acyltransferase 4-like n=1 Tax=Myotis yumanensis TaxID=159337 RepID=UPI0038D44BF2
MASFREEPKPGDLIEISRIGYSHWALYVGDGYVIHLAPPDEYPGAGSSSLFSVLSSRGMVKRELLSDVVGGCRYRVNNHLDHEYSPLPVNKIISSAEEMVGKELAYSVLSRNCEHFVTDLRYGKARSPQAEKFVTGASVTLGAAVGAALAFSVMKKRSQHQ